MQIKEHIGDFDMPRIFCIIFLLLITPASSQTYLSLTDLPTAQSRSQAECVRRGCDGTLTKFWWNIVSHPSNGQAAIVVELNGLFANDGLTAAEKAAIRTRLQAIAAGWFAKLVTGTTVNGSPNINNLADTTSLIPGLIVTTVSGTSRGISSGTTILSINSLTSITLSANCVNGGTAPTNCGVTALQFNPSE